MFRHVLFDLDGTLTESHEGILRSVAYALEKEGEPTDGRLDRKIVIGPPLMYTFTHTYRFPKEKARRVYGYFQERYGTVGLFENHPYDGIPALLKSLQMRASGLMWRHRSRAFMPLPFVMHSA